MTENSLSPASITSGLETRFIGQKIIYYPTLTSTMETARQEAEQSAKEGTVIIANQQTAGRGRLQRLWVSPKGNIALSVILRPTMAYLPSLIMLASLAVVHSIEAITALRPQLKWPNDVLIRDKKVCGILTESKVQPNTVDYSIVGIGVNVNLRLADFPDISSIATSLSNELGREVSRLSLIRRLLVKIETLYLALLAEESIYQEWQSNLVTLGKMVRVTSGETIQEGIAESVARDGSLLLRRLDGSLTKILAGDVTLRD